MRLRCGDTRVRRTFPWLTSYLEEKTRRLADRAAAFVEGKARKKEAAREGGLKV